MQLTNLIRRYEGNPILTEDDLPGSDSTEDHSGYLA